MGRLIIPATYTPLNDSFPIPLSPDTRWQLNEDVGRDTINGVDLLARARGPFFLVDAASRNERYYTRQLWEKVIVECAEVIESGQMIGTIGHDQPLDDKALMEGLASHRITKLWIVEGSPLGWGELVVLNTDVGRRLNGYLRGGMRLPISSRAYGDYLATPRADGMREVDPDKFILETFDFVRFEGAAGAVPRLVEHAPSTTTISLPPVTQKGTPVMTPDTETPTKPVSPVILESIQREKMQLNEQLTTAIKENERLVNEAKLHDYKRSEVATTLTEAQATVTALTEKVAALEQQTEAYAALGDPGLVSQTFEATQKIAEQLTAIGGIAAASDAIARNKQYEVLATLAEVKQLIALAKAYKPLGTPEQLKEALTALATYIKMGSPKQIQQTFEESLVVAGRARAERVSRASTKLASKYGVDPKQAKTLVEKVGATEAGTILAGLTGGSTLQERYSIPDDAVYDEEFDEELGDGESDEALLGMSEDYEAPAPRRTPKPAPRREATPAVRRPGRESGEPPVVRKTVRVSETEAGRSVFTGDRSTRLFESGSF